MTDTLPLFPLDQYPARGRVEALVPPVNVTAGQELAQLLEVAATVHVTRFPALERPLEERLASYNEAVPAILTSLAGRSCDAVVMACSGSRYLLGPDRDRDICQQWSADFGMPVATATLATAEMLHLLGARDLVLVSPYAEWLTKRARTYWRRAGMSVRVVTIQTADGRFAPYEVSGADLLRQIEQAHLPSDAVVLCTGTGMATLNVLKPLGEGNDRILLTSNLCSAWWALRRSSERTGPIPRKSLPWPLQRLAGQGLPA
ncbi:maleate cis-trans isomerase family protein [Nonomuraea sp. NPDC003707]